MCREDVKETVNSPSSSKENHTENNQSPNPVIHSPVPIHNKPNFASPIIVDTSIQQYPTLSRLFNGIKNFLDAQKSVLIAQNPGIMLENAKFRLIKKSEFDQFEKFTIPLMNSMLTEFFEPFLSLNQEEKMLILRIFALKFSIMIKMYQTIKTFPDIQDTRGVVHYCYIYDTKNIDAFVCEYENPEQHFKLTDAILKRARELANKFLAYNFGDMECAALSYIIFSIASEKVPNIEPQVERIKNMVFKEIHGYYVTNFGVEQGGIKFCQLFHSIFHEIMIFYNKLHEDLTVATVFLEDFFDTWMDMNAFEDK
uniref:NR LBD domain-containing protein n=1 Tax=Acrobeloides nanus TaxID=290746 RepID=A0A914DP75_9BILA